jgi:hypothetical protein
MVLQKMEILPVNDLDIALHNFVNKDDKMAFYTCVQYNIDETRVRFFMIFIHFYAFVCDTHAGASTTYCIRHPIY